MMGRWFDRATVGLSTFELVVLGLAVPLMALWSFFVVAVGTQIGQPPGRFVTPTVQPAYVEQAPSPSVAPEPPVPMSATSTRPPVATKPPRPRQPTPTTREAYYANCAAVRAAGKAPLYQGQPGYGGALDRDHDGIACE